jgi:hypothetical protein
LRSCRFWNACQAAKPPNGTLVKAGFDIEFEPTELNEIDAVTFRLNDTWKAILERTGTRRVK